MNITVNTAILRATIFIEKCPDKEKSA